VFGPILAFAWISLPSIIKSFENDQPATTIAL
jgi:hypothetical protein